MNAMNSTQHYFDSAAANVAAQSQDGVLVDETYWGYIIRSGGDVGTIVKVLQGLAWMVGVTCFTAALGLVLLPGSGDIAAFGMKIGVASLIASCGWMMLWYASRGGVTEIHVDTRLGEVREIVRNRAGKPTLLGRFGFDCIGGVFLDQKSQKPNGAHLLLRCHNASQVISVAFGPALALEKLQDRLGRDMLIEAPARPIPA